MKRGLMMAYDLLHQVQCLPYEEKNSTWVDNVPTEFTLEQRAEMIVRDLERAKFLVAINELDHDEGDEAEWANEESIRQGRQQ